MAKWGEGDPRWIVEERPDATNVNNWHWYFYKYHFYKNFLNVFFRTEKNASYWSKEKLESLLKNLIIEDEKLGRCKIKEINSIEGEAVANNRKGKLIFFYEWNIKCSWVGQFNNDPEEYNGKIEIPNLSEENSAEDITINVSLEDSKNNQGELLKEMVRIKGLKLIQDKMNDYIVALRNEFAKDMIKPTKFTPSGNINSFQTENQQTNKQILNCAPSLTKNIIPSSSGKLDTINIKLVDNFKCTPEELYRVFTDPKLLQIFAHYNGSEKVEVGLQFSLFNGNIIGKYLQLDPHLCIRQCWRLKNWPENHYSEVIITFDKKTDSTELTLIQNGVPETEKERTEQGWKTFYFEQIKRSFGFGFTMF